MTPVLTVTDMPSPEATRTIEDGLSIYNRAASGIADARDLAVLITDPESGETLGGLVGRTSLGLLFVDLFHVPEAMRGSGLGSRIMEVAEEEARRRGCVSSRPSSSPSISRRRISTSATVMWRWAASRRFPASHVSS